MKKKDGIESNIWKLYVIKAVTSFMLIMPVIAIFFQENGLSMKDIFVLQAVFSASLILLEIPSGYFSDKVGRKKALIIGYLFAIVGHVVYSLVGGFWGFLWAEVLLGIGCSFVSGTDSALLYDSLLEAKEESIFTEIEGRRFSLGMISEALASVAGGFIAVVSLRLPFYVETAILVAGFPVVLSIIEPKVCAVMNKQNALEVIRDVFKKIICKDSKLKWVMMYSSIIGSSTLTMVWMIQPYLKEVNIPLGLFGIIWASCMVVSAVASWYAGALEKYFGTKKVLSSLIVLVVTGYFSLYLSWSAWAVVFLGLLYVVRGLHNPVVSAYINGQVSSDIRATILSAKNLFGRVLFSIIGPFIGYLADIVSLSAAMAYAGGIFALMGITALLFLHKSKVL